MGLDNEQAVRGNAPAHPVVTVNIFGADYAIRSGADPEYIRKVAAHVDRLMRQIASRVHHVSATKIAVLASLQLTDQLFSERSEIQTDHRLIAERTDSLLSRLDQTLLDVVEPVVRPARSKE